MEKYERIIQNAFDAHDREFLLEMLRYAPDYEEDQIEETMIELNICPNCAGELELIADEETHGYTADFCMCETFRYKKCSTCGWE